MIFPNIRFHSNRINIEGAHLKHWAPIRRTGWVNCHRWLLLSLRKQTGYGIDQFSFLESDGLREFTADINWFPMDETNNPPPAQEKHTRRPSFCSFPSNQISYNGSRMGVESFELCFVGTPKQEITSHHSTSFLRVLVA
jgi:hypothetical protein